MYKNVANHHLTNVNAVYVIETSIDLRLLNLNISHDHDFLSMALVLCYDE